MTATHSEINRLRAELAYLDAREAEALHRAGDWRRAGESVAVSVLDGLVQRVRNEREQVLRRIQELELPH